MSHVCLIDYVSVALCSVEHIALGLNLSVLLLSLMDYWMGPKGKTLLLKWLLMFFWKSWSNNYKEPKDHWAMQNNNNKKTPTKREMQNVSKNRQVCSAVLSLINKNITKKAFFMYFGYLCMVLKFVWWSELLSLNFISLQDVSHNIFLCTAHFYTKHSWILHPTDITHNLIVSFRF